jgi:hypothetical protein
MLSGSIFTKLSVSTVRHNMYTLQYNGMNLDFNGYRISAEGAEPPVSVKFNDYYAQNSNVSRGSPLP